MIEQVLRMTAIFRFLLLVTAALWASGSPAVRADTSPKLGILAISEADSIDALVEQLKLLGWNTKQEYEIVFPKSTSDPAQLAKNMQVLLDENVTVVVAQTKLAVEIAKRATSSIPIVMGAFNGDPVAEGFVASIDRPGGNITGSFYNVTSGGAERVATLAALMPNLKHVGIVMNPNSKPSRALADNLSAAAVQRNLVFSLLSVAGPNDVDRAFADARQEGVEGVVVVTGAEMFAIRRELVAAQDKYRLPTVTGSIGYADLGGVAKLGPNVPDLWRKMAPIVDKLLRRTAAAGELALVTVDKFELDINLGAATRLGLSVPEDLKRTAHRILP